MSISQKTESKGKFKIAHSLEELQDELVLTLKDQPLLKNNKQVNEDEDLFENEELQNINRMKHNAELRKKVKELSDVTTSHLVTKQQGASGILPHYDDHSYQAAEIQVQINGIIKSKKPKSFRTSQSDFLTRQQSQSLKLGSEYNQIRIKKTAKKSTSQQQQYNTSDLLSFLNQTAEDDISQNDMKRSAEQAIEDALDSIRKKRITEFNAKREVDSVDISSIIGVNQEEEILNQSIMKAQRKKQQQMKNVVLQAIKQDQDEDDQAEKTVKKQVQIQLNPITYTGEDKKYVRRDFDVSGMKSGTTSAMFIKLPSQRLVKKQQKDQLPQSFKDLSPQQLEKMRQQVSFLEDKAVGTGLSGTLQYLRENSLLKRQQEVGRSTDKSLNNINDPNDRIKLQYRNANGQLMKPKQAFRYLCATFHGQGPGKNKIQKRKKKQLLEMQMKQKQNTDGQFMSLLNQHQRKSNQAYMVIDFGKKAAFSKN